MIEIRTATEADWPEMFAHDVRSFGSPFEAEAADILRRTLDLDRFVVARDTEDGALAGVAGSFALTLTVPGGAQLAAPGVTWVSVAPSHRRLGVLRMMLDELHERYAAEGAAVAILTASEGTIYERFGYGTASFVDEVTIDRRTARLRAPAPGPAGRGPWKPVRPRPGSRTCTGAGTPPPRDPYRRNSSRGAVPRRSRVGTMGRFRAALPGAPGRLRDVPGRREGPCGTARCEGAQPTPRLLDLWQTVLGLDIFDHVTADLPADHPLREMLVDSRSVKTTARKDELWLKFIDLPAALEARTYDRDGDLVLAVDGAGYRLRIADGVARCSPSDAEPVARLSGATLAGLYLGATAPSTMAAAGRIDGDFRALSVFRTERQPELGTSF
ncbi:N-acetyltransferase domain-containing protein OS=Tsukamurella paurometabola (strain ATCC 8368 / DSM / CCUG 35730 / CIP 100753 / JCM 10117 / KCTC 9821 /NBRC 16120 / NCIMB 702349 / NCTC 13040) OX=521096 GN=Tpau_0834 PE=3 SV=1 [Tsukamurella paurometabola]